MHRVKECSVSHEALKHPKTECYYGGSLLLFHYIHIVAHIAFRDVLILVPWPFRPYPSFPSSMLSPGLCFCNVLRVRPGLRGLGDGLRLVMSAVRGIAVLMGRGFFLSSSGVVAEDAPSPNVSIAAVVEPGSLKLVDRLMVGVDSAL